MLAWLLLHIERECMERRSIYEENINRWSKNMPMD